MMELVIVDCVIWGEIIDEVGVDDENGSCEVDEL